MELAEDGTEEDETMGGEERDWDEGIAANAYVESSFAYSKNRCPYILYYFSSANDK